MSTLVSGVWPVLATPFLPDGTPDEAGLAAVARYALGSGVDGVVYPGRRERIRVADAGRARRAWSMSSPRRCGATGALVVGGSAADPAITHAAMRQAARVGAAARDGHGAPGSHDDAATIADFFARRAASARQRADHAAERAAAGRQRPAGRRRARASRAQCRRIAYVKEEALPSGARITPPARRRAADAARRARRRGWALHHRRARAGRDRHDAGGRARRAARRAVRARIARATGRGAPLFNRMLPVLNLQAVFRWALTKEVLRRRGVIAHAGKRATRPGARCRRPSRARRMPRRAARRAAIRRPTACRPRR